MIATTRYKGYHRNGVISYHVSIEKVDLKWFLFGKLYHWYDMRFPLHVPGWRRFEKFLSKHGAEHMVGEWDDDTRKPRLRDKMITWTVHQDFRCFELNHKKRKVIKVVDLTEEEYNSLGKAAD